MPSDPSFAPPPARSRPPDPATGLEAGPHLAPPLSQSPAGPPALEPGTVRMGLIAGGLGAGLVLAIAAWGALGHRHGPVPVIEAKSTPVRVRPEHPGGMEAEPGGMDTEGAGTADAHMESAPEAPDTAALQAKIRAHETRSDTPDAAGPKAPAVDGAQETRTDAAPPAPTATPAATPAETTPDPIPAPAPVSHPAPARPIHETAGPVQIQLAALGDEAEAKTEWDRLRRTLPDLLRQRQPVYSRTRHDGHEFTRLRLGGFADVADATRFCQQVRAKGAACSVAAF